MIIPLKYFEWVANLVPIIKKSGEIMLYVDLISMNTFSLKEKYLFPKMDHILHKLMDKIESPWQIVS
jgi:hypothetical protein